MVRLFRLAAVKVVEFSADSFGFCTPVPVRMHCKTTFEGVGFSVYRLPDPRDST